ncbi:MAG: ABC transporter substrate-binding protein [Clostridia bacterium]|nr:ABC transporter substrate-binding protein [Clostridia bacterium]
MKKVIRILALVLVLVMVASAIASCGAKYKGKDTLVVGYSNFSGKFSPFFATTAYDQDVAGMTQLGLLSTDREGNIVYNGIKGEKRTYNGTEYTYTGIADVTETINADKTVDYKIVLKKGVTFSDGKKMTANDVLFSMYVLSDPTYDGSSSFSALPIEGMEAYLAGMDARGKVIFADGKDGYKANDKYTEAQYNAFWDYYDNKAGADFAQEIVDYCKSKGYNAATDTVAQCAATWGFKDLAENATAQDFWNAIVAAYPTVEAAESTESAGSTRLDFTVASSAEFQAGVVIGETAANISGIKKVNDYEITVKMTKFDATAIYQLGITVAPLHYYGDEAQFDIAANKFGFTKGDLSGVKSKTSNPMGAGPYKFVSYENGVVTFEKNDRYFKGAPKITYIKFQETGDADKVPGVTSGLFDVTDPSFNNTAVENIKKANSNGQITGNIVTTSTVDNLGYGYIGANATTVSVDGKPDSAESKALRKAFATLFAVNRDKNVFSYYGERASIIQYPISNTSWAAPKPNDAGYAIAYSKDVDGKDIYTANMSEDEKKAAALEAAIGFFKKAGYTWDEAAKKFTAAPNGAQMEYEVIVPGDGVGDHPAYGVLTDTKAQLETIGITLTINDPANSNILWDALDAGTQNFWTAAWGASVDPDMYQVYYSQNVVGLEGSTGSNHYRIQDNALDQKIMAARESADHDYRKSVYKECLDIILDWGVEIPTYQRQNAIIFSTERVNMATVTPDITTFWGWMNDIELLEMN